MLPSLYSQTIFSKELQISVKINNASQEDYPICLSIILLNSSLNWSEQKYKITFTSPQDLFFLFSMDIDKKALQQYNSMYGIKVQNVNELVKMLQNLILQVSLSKKQALLKFVNQHTLKFQIYNIFNAKRFVLIQIQANKQNQEQTQNWAAFKYGQMRAQINNYEVKISQLKQLIKIKNPYLLHHLDKI